MMPQYVEYYKLRRFLNSFADEAIAVDPLDRELWSIQNQDDDGQCEISETVYEN